MEFCRKIDEISDNIFVYTNKHFYTCNMIIVAKAIDTIFRVLLEYRNTLLHTTRLQKI